MRRRSAILLAALWAAGCMAGGATSADSVPGATTDAVTEPGQEPGQEPETAVYRCTTPEGTVTLVTRTRPNGLHLFLPPDLNQVYLNCEHDRRASIWEHAKLSGVDFRAVGNEPGWVLEIREGNRLDLSYDYGQATLSAAITATETDSEARTTIYRGADGGRQLEVRLSGQTCSDTMAEETYPTRVEVIFEDRRLTGCGRPLH